MSKLSVVIGSTRPGRVGLPVGQWFFERAKEHGKFELDLVDLKERDLPLIDKPKHPRLREYEHGHILRGSESHEKAAATMLDELYRWTGALATLRE